MTETTPAKRDEGVGPAGRRALLAAVVITIGLFLVPGGDLIGRPLVWVSTLAHELGHATVAAAVGGDVESVHVFTDGSGVAVSTRPPGRLRTAAISAGGLIGPAVVAALLFVFARRARSARVAAGVMGVALLLTVVFALRGPLATTLGVVIGGVLILLALRSKTSLTQIVLVFFAVQLALSVFSRGDYLFTNTAQTAAGPAASDSAQIATALVGPYWLWGAVCGLISVVVLLFGIVTFLHEAQRRRTTA